MLAFVAGYFVIGIVAGIVWLILFQDVPPDGGSGNSRESYAWFGIGGTIGAVMATAAALWLTRRSPPSDDWLKDSEA